MEFLMKILVIAAHYDDAEIGCGGTIMKHISAGDEIRYAITSADEYRTGDPQERLDEQCDVLKRMGLNTTDMILFSYRDELSTIIGTLDSFKPDIVFTHFENDTHQEHARASTIGQAVGRKRGITTVFYDSGSSYNFTPNIFSMIDFDEKMYLLEVFKSQIAAEAISLDIIKRKNAYWSTLITNNPSGYAEGFVVRKMKWII